MQFLAHNKALIFQVIWVRMMQPSLFSLSPGTMSAILICILMALKEKRAKC